MNVQTTTQATNGAVNTQNTNVAAVPSLIPRVDLLGNNVLFLADTHNRETNMIQYWDGKKGHKPSEAPTEFYKSTKPIKAEETVKKLIQDYSSEFRVKEVLVRQRLVKEGAVQRNVSGGIDAKDVDDFKTRLTAAVTKLIAEFV